jgi:hypothetical protein
MSFSLQGAYIGSTATYSFGSVPYIHVNDGSLYSKPQPIFVECKLMRLGSESTIADALKGHP